MSPKLWSVRSLVCGRFEPRFQPSLPYGLKRLQPRLARRCGSITTDITYIPMSALHGDSVVQDGPNVQGLTGVSAPYEVPESPELRIDTGRVGVDAAIDMIVERLRKAGVINGE